MKQRMLSLAALALGLALCDAGCRLAPTGDSDDGSSAELGDGVGQLGDGDGDGDGADDAELDPPADLYTAYATATGPACGLDGGAIARCEPLDLCLEPATASCERVGSDGEFATCGGDIYGAWATAAGPACGHDDGAVARCLPGDACAVPFDATCQFVRTRPRRATCPTRPGPPRPVRAAASTVARSRGACRATCVSIPSRPAASDHKHFQHLANLPSGGLARARQLGQTPRAMDTKRTLGLAALALALALCNAGCL
jgi:hypothetical protein